jgi:hypothetical protein
MVASSWTTPENASGLLGPMRARGRHGEGQSATQLGVKISRKDCVKHFITSKPSAVPYQAAPFKSMPHLPSGTFVQNAEIPIVTLARARFGIEHRCGVPGTVGFRGHPEGRHGKPVADGSAFDVQDITDAVMYLTDAATITGDILYVDGGSHFGRW